MTGDVLFTFETGAGIPCLEKTLKDSGEMRGVVPSTTEAPLRYRTDWRERGMGDYESFVM